MREERLTGEEGVRAEVWMLRGEEGFSVRVELMVVRRQGLGAGVGIV